MNLKKLVQTLCIAGGISIAFFASSNTAIAAEEVRTINKGIYIGEFDLSDKTPEDAKREVEAYLEEEKKKSVTFQIGENKTTITAGELGITWSNEEVIDEAAIIGHSGNIIQKYKTLKDLEENPVYYPLEYSVDRSMVEAVINQQCLQFDTEPVNASFKRENGEFIVEDGKKGSKLNIEESVELVYDYMENSWNMESASIDLPVEEAEPEYNGEDLKLVKDVLGTFSTDFSSSSESRAMNLDTGAEKINGSIIYPGEEFSVYEVTHPYTEENGYGYGSAFENGKVVPSLGGGICQVSTTLYNAVLRSELEVTERSNHTMQVSYVKPSMDAAIAGTYMDLKFKNNTDSPIYIEGYTKNREITFTIYGHETRSADREVRYESETTGTLQPGVRIEASNAAIGSITQTQSPVAGLSAKLWKIVTENGKETRTQVNSSTYYPSDTIYSVGTASNDPNKTAAMKAAIATGNMDQVRTVANSLLAPTPEPETETPSTEKETPETTAPETTPPETTAPETSAPETQAPDTPSEDSNGEGAE
ncbi:MAG TPA: VanW family protein [Candidatus Merdenecus merdavium]|nr:VanW family protein [Candidatus Merdenecus merdavium]